MVIGPPLIAIVCKGGRGGEWENWILRAISSRELHFQVDCSEGTDLSKQLSRFVFEYLLTNVLHKISDEVNALQHRPHSPVLTFSTYFFLSKALLIFKLRIRMTSVVANELGRFYHHNIIWKDCIMDQCQVNKNWKVCSKTKAYINVQPNHAIIFATNWSICIGL